MLADAGDIKGNTTWGAEHKACINSDAFFVVSSFQLYLRSSFLVTHESLSLEIAVITMMRFTKLPKFYLISEPSTPK